MSPSDEERVIAAAAFQSETEKQLNQQKCQEGDYVTLDGFPAPIGV